MGQTFVLPNNATIVASSKDYAMYGFRSILPTASITGQVEDPDHPFSFCTDYMDDTQYSPLADSGTAEIDIATGQVESINYIGLGIFNGLSAGLALELEYYNIETAQYVQVASFSDGKDTSPKIFQFDAVASNKFKIKLTWTAKLWVGCIYLGSAIRFPTTPSVGFQPGKYNRLDEVKSFQTAGNNFTRSRLVVKNNQSKGTFNFYLFAELSKWWSEYLDHIYASKPVFFAWSSNVDDPMYGRENVKTPPRITYKNSFNAAINFEFNGYADR